MKKILSQEEMETLLKGVEDGRIATSTDAGSQFGVRHYDFREGAALYRNLRHFQSFSERVSQNLKDVLSTLLFKTFEISTTPPEVLNFGELQKMVQQGSCAGILRIKSDSPPGLFIFDPVLIYLLLELYFGGKGTAVQGEINENPLTPVKERVMRKVLKMITEQLNGTIKEYADLEIDLDKLESNLSILNLYEPDDPIIKTEFQIGINEATGRSLFCVPPAVVKSLRVSYPKVVEKERAITPDDRVTRTLVENLMNAEVEVVVELARIELTFEELRELSEGNVIATGKALDAEVTVLVQGVQKFRGQIGNRKGYQSVKITRVD